MLTLSSGREVRLRPTRHHLSGGVGVRRTKAIKMLKQFVVNAILERQEVDVLSRG
jgi:hypothetical protein